LRRIVELHLTLVGQDRDLAIMTQVELRHSTHFMDQLSRNQVGDYLAILAEVVAQGQAEGRFRKNLDPVFAAKAIFGVLDEMATDWVLSQRNKRLESQVGAVAEFLLGGLTA
jgi:TetR/AcrR family fatty acid metabolism transcriptional regulator